MDSVFESSFNLKRFETKWEAFLENVIGYDVRQKTFGNEKSSNVLDTIDTLPYYMFFVPPPMIHIYHMYSSLIHWFERQRF